MPNKPYPSQTAPTRPKRPKRIGDGSKIPKPAQMPKQMGPDKGKVIKPYKGPRATSGGPSSTGPKRGKPSEMQSPEEIAQMRGIMGATKAQKEASYRSMMNDMRNRNALRSRKLNKK
jgi:hypothetical protein